MPKPKLIAAPELDPQYRLTRVVDMLREARTASGCIIGLSQLHEKIVDIKDDEANGDVADWYGEFYAGAIRETIRHLAETASLNINSAEDFLAPLLKEKSHGEA